MHMPYAETGALARLNDALAAAAFSCALHPPAGSVFSTICAGLKSAICLQRLSHVLTRLYAEAASWSSIDHDVLPDAWLALHVRADCPLCHAHVSLQAESTLTTLSH